VYRDGSEVERQDTVVMRKKRRDSMTSGDRSVLVLIFLAIALCISCASTTENTVVAYHGTSDPDSIEEAQEVLRWICALSERENRMVLSGQEIGCYDAEQGYYDYVLGLERRVGQRPALIETDYFAGIAENFIIDAENKNRVLARHWADGGLVALHVNFGNPWTGGSVNDCSRGSGSFSDTYTPGTAAYNALKRDYDAVADLVLELQELGVVVLFRPFHEVNGAWFWWYSEKPEEFHHLWRYWHGYLRGERGVHNLLYVYSPSPVRTEYLRRNGPARYYPGHEWVDITALDYYSSDFSNPPMRNYTDMVKLGKPFGFGELGGPFPPTEENRNWPLTQISRAMEHRFTKAFYWLSWSSWETNGVMSMVDLPEAEELFAHPLIASLSDIDRPIEPSFRLLTMLAEDADENPERIRVGSIDFSSGYIFGHPNYFEEGLQTLQDTRKDDIELIRVRGVLSYRFPDAVQRLVERDNCSIIIVDLDGGLEESLITAARLYPDVTFITAFQPAFTGISNIRTFGINNGGWNYLAGIIAGAATQSGKVGYAGYSEAEWSIRNANEFALGVQETNPDAEVLFTVSSDSDVQAIRRLVESGCDTFNAVASWMEPIRELRAHAVEGRRIVAFSFQADRRASPGIIACGIPENQGAVYIRILDDILGGPDIPNPYWSDIRSGAVRIGAGTEPLDPAVKTVLTSVVVHNADSGTMNAYDYVMARYDGLRSGRLNLPEISGSTLQPNVRRLE
jgi:mannan endo-1,4-beta-mannosidase